MKTVTKLLIVFTILLIVPLSYAQYDINGNGTIDLPLTLVDGNQLRWFGQDLTSDEVFQMGLFGHPDYQVGIGHWLSVNTINRVYVRKNLFGDFELFSDVTNFGYQLGQSHDDAIVIIDRDIDSSGLLDAALINGERKKWAWKFSFDPLSIKSSKRRILYGRKKHIPFLFRSRGNSDSLGLLQGRGKRSKITYRPLRGRRKRSVRLRGHFTPSKQQPILIRNSKGRDGFGFISEGKFTVFSARGRTNGLGTSLPRNSSILIGNFEGDIADEVTIFTEGKILFTDGELKRLSDENLKPLVGQQSEKYIKEEISPTIIPTNTPTVTPTNTAVPTNISTLIPTFTAIPTYTPQPTFTSFPTFTATSTYTPTTIPSPTVTPTVTPTRGAFISTWKTDNSGGVSNNDQITLPLESDGNYDFDVDWGDGSLNTITTWNQSEVTHTYASPGIYTISISGVIIGFRFADSGDKTKIVDISQWGVLRVGNNQSYFQGCNQLNSTASDSLDLTGTTSLRQMFQDAPLFNGNINSWDTSAVLDMKEIFKGASSFNRNISNWDTSKVTTMQGAFNEASSFDQDISNWDTSANTSFHSTFRNADKFNANISSWNTSNVVSMRNMFQNAITFNRDIDSWDTSKVTTMFRMFLGASSFNRDISNWDTSSTINMSEMFQDATSFNQDLSRWCVSTILSKPNKFDLRAGAWSNDPAWRPQWGTCPGTPTPTP